MDLSAFSTQRDEYVRLAVRKLTSFFAKQAAEVPTPLAVG